METRKTDTAERRTDSAPIEDFDRDGERTDQRLESLLKMNADFAHEKELYRFEDERFEGSLLEHPLTTEEVFARFGLFLGTFPPAVIFGKFIFEALDGNPNDEYWVIPLLLFVNFITATAGFYSGKLVGKIMGELEKLPWLAMILALPFVGLLWG
ncbi:MAG: hypothetical protein HKN25_11525, partial [Pyrinomonadaceae bacterium]|nr:hypothetical protein [Pyrinomonadaceae bacterium]